MAFNELLPLDHNFIPGAMVSGTVGSLIDNGDDFLFYPINGSEVIADVSPFPAWQLGLMPGEIITLQVGEWNGREIDTNNIIRPDGSTVLGLSNIPPMTMLPNIDPLTGFGLATLSGTVISQTEPDSFFLQSDIGPILIDAIPQGEGIVTVIPGEILNIVGDFDDYDFDAYILTRLDGSAVLPLQPMMAFPPASIPPVNSVLSNRIQMEITDINNSGFAGITNIPNPPLNPGNTKSQRVGDSDLNYDYDQSDFDSDSGRSRRRFN